MFSSCSANVRKDLDVIFQKRQSEKKIMIQQCDSPETSLVSPYSGILVWTNMCDVKTYQ